MAMILSVRGESGYCYAMGHGHVRGSDLISMVRRSFEDKGYRVGAAMILDLRWVSVMDLDVGDVQEVVSIETAHTLSGHFTGEKHIVISRGDFDDMTAKLHHAYAGDLFPPMHIVYDTATAIVAAQLDEDQAEKFRQTIQAMLDYAKVEMIGLHVV